MLALMTTSIIWLLYLLRDQEAQMSHDCAIRDTFKKEKRALIWILCVFDASYAVRAAYESTVINSYSKNMYVTGIFNIVVDGLPDLVPITLILVMHYRNFVVREDPSATSNIRSKAGLTLTHT
mmetsp:Transcript_16748/g.21175  ORF Transcript_16748/g.21175 Transcript_16748/m.21175 type:complete len:123 (-) Transcript_16748:360-728(-)